jgi:hypothetical protein
MSFSSSLLEHGEVKFRLLLQTEEQEERYLWHSGGKKSSVLKPLRRQNLGVKDTKGSRFRGFMAYNGVKYTETPSS